MPELPGRNWIECSKCRGWYHIRTCVSVSEKHLKLGYPYNGTIIRCFNRKIACSALAQGKWKLEQKLAELERQRAAHKLTAGSTGTGTGGTQKDKQTQDCDTSKQSKPDSKPSSNKSSKPKRAAGKLQKIYATDDVTMMIYMWSVYTTCTFKVTGSLKARAKEGMGILRIQMQNLHVKYMHT